MFSTVRSEMPKSPETIWKKKKKKTQGFRAADNLFNIKLQPDVLLNSPSAWKYENERELRLILLSLDLPLKSANLCMTLGLNLSGFGMTLNLRLFKKF